MEQNGLLERLFAEKMQRRAFELRRYEHDHIKDEDEYKAAIKAAKFDDFVRKAVDENSRITEIVRARLMWTSDQVPGDQGSSRAE